MRTQDANSIASKTPKMLTYFLHKIKEVTVLKNSSNFSYELRQYYKVIFLDLKKGLNWLWIEKKKTTIYLVPNC